MLRCVGNLDETGIELSRRILVTQGYLRSGRNVPALYQEGKLLFRTILVIELQCFLHTLYRVHIMPGRSPVVRDPGLGVPVARRYFQRIVRFKILIVQQGNHAYMIMGGGLERYSIRSTPD